MAIKDIVKGICNITRCKYDVYTKERTDELLGEFYKKTELNDLLGGKVNKPVILFDDTFTLFNETSKTLNDSVSNYDRIVIYYGYGSDERGLIAVLNPKVESKVRLQSVKTMPTTDTLTETNGYGLYMSHALVQVSGTTISVDKTPSSGTNAFDKIGRLHIENGAIKVYDKPYIQIYRVEGYKF